MQMRFAVVVNRYPPLQGGVEFHAQNLASNLTRLGHEVWVLTIGEHAETRDDDGVHVAVERAHLPIADVISFPALGATRRIARFLRKKRIDVVSVHTRFFPMTFVGLQAAKRSGIPVIHTEHGSDFVSSSSPLISLGAKIVDLTLGRYVLRGAKEVLAVSEQSAAFARRLGARTTKVFYNAITSSSERREHLDRPQHLVFVGRMVEGKGWDTFLDALAILHRGGINIEGEILGGGAQLDEARAQARRLGLESIVTIRGRVDPSQVRSSLAGATLVNPTVLSEGFQTTLLEALAEGGRVVTYDVPGAALLHEQGHPVVICKKRTVESLVESLKTLLADPPAPSEPSMMNEWTWPTRAREYAQIAQAVVEKC